MPTPTPILDGELILSTALRNAVAPAIVPAGYFHNGKPKIYWRINTDGSPLPYLIMRPLQDITPREYLQARPIRVPVLLVAYAEIKAGVSAARTLLNIAATALLAGLSYEGYVVSAEWKATPNLPPTANAWAVGHRFDVAIARYVAPDPGGETPPPDPSSDTLDLGTDPGVQTGVATDVL